MLQNKRKLLGLLASVVMAHQPYAQEWKSLGKEITPSNAHTKFCTAAGGAMYVAYDNLMNGRVTVKKYESGKWKTLGKEEFSDGQVSYISLAVNTVGNPYVAYRDEKSGRPVIQYYDGNKWTLIGTSPSENKVSQVSLCVDGNKQVFVAFNDQSAGMVVVKKWDNSSWKTVGTNNPSEGSGQEVVLSCDHQNNLYVVYADNTNGRKATVKKLVNNAWVPVGGQVSAHEAKYLNIAFTDKGQPYFLYQDAFDNAKIRLKMFDGKNWMETSTPAFTSSYNDNLSLLLDASNVPYVAFHDSRNNTHKVDIKKWLNGKWEDVGDHAGGGSFVSLASDGSKTLYVLFNDDSNENRAGVYGL